MSKQFDIMLENTSESDQSIELFDGTDFVNNAQSNKYRFTTAYQTAYVTGMYFRVLAGDINHIFNLDSSRTPEELINDFNGLEIGTWSLFASNAVDGNVFDVISPVNVSELEITSGNAGIGKMKIGSTFIIG